MKVQTPISASRLTPGHSRGFTLLELLIVCTLIALATGLVGSFLAGSDQKQFSTNLREITSRLKNARRKAIITGVEQHVRLATAAEERFAGEEDAQQPPDWVNPAMRLRFAATLDDSLEDTQDLVVTFFPLGSSTGGLLQVSDPSEREAYVYVFPLTGKLLTASSMRSLEDQLREQMQ